MDLVRWLSVSVVIAAIVVLTGYFFGYVPAALLGILVTLVLILVMTLRRGRPGLARRACLRAAMISGFLGCIIGVASSALALAAVGGNPAYSSRLLFGGIALAAALYCTVATALTFRGPKLAGVILVVAGFAGGVSINLFFINTFYILAVPLWWTAAFFALLAPTGNDAAIQN